jgi:3-isopropylmalate/(R)-2-methylmalate dehydratase large subunit
VLRGPSPWRPGVVLKVVPSSTDRVWKRLLEDGTLEALKEAGALVGNAGCAGCAAGQIGQNGPGEVTVSTGNRNFAGKQGRGEVFLVSPAVAAASAVAGVIARPDAMPDRPVAFETGTAVLEVKEKAAAEAADLPTTFRGRAWVVRVDNVDTDMIYHNRHLSVTDLAEMGQHALGNLEGFESFAREAKPGDIVVAGGNFGCGSSRQQAVDCFRSLGVTCVVARSFGSIYERNAINSGFPIVTADLVSTDLETGQEIEVDLTTGRITLPSDVVVEGEPFSDVQLEIYRRGGLLG